MTRPESKTLMRSLGEFVGHIWSGITTNTGTGTGAESDGVQEVRRTIETEDRGDVVLRRTTIEEVEIRPPTSDAAPRPDHPSPDRPPDAPSAR